MSEVIDHPPFAQEPRHALEGPRQPISSSKVHGRHRMMRPARYPETPPVPIVSMMTAFSGLVALHGAGEVNGSFQSPPPQEAPPPYVANVPVMSHEASLEVSQEPLPVTGAEIAKLHTE